jgi:hypothetical protein
MKTIQIQTLVDITATGVVRINQGTQLQVDQNKNFNTIRQCLEMRSVILYDAPPTVEKIKVDGLGFGSQFRGQHTVWTFTFTPDRSDAYIDSNGDEIGFLFNDLHEVPIIINLSETINIVKAIFDCKDPKYKNIIVKAQLGTVEAN